MKSQILSAVLLSTAVLGFGSAACSSGSGSGGAGGTGSTTATGTTTSKSATSSKSGVTAGPTSGTGGTGGAAEDGTSGKTCTTDADCDKTGAKTAVCTIAPHYGTAPDLSTDFPTPICIQTAPCDIGTGTTIQSCDAQAGICLDSGNGQLMGVCLPFCQFDSTGATYTGNCPGKDACNPYGFGKDMNNAPFGVGYCFEGCLKDADCTNNGEKCDIGDGLCKLPKLITAPTKLGGDACTGTTDTACNCGVAKNQTTGQCLQFCKVGDAGNTCQANTICDAQIPPTLTTPFTKVPPGVAGNCLKTCTVPTDCGALPFCYASGGETQKTCHFGPSM